MKHCNSAGVHWHVALLEFLFTPGPDGHSPGELLGRQFRGILPMIDTNTVNSDKFAARKDKEKEKFDNKHPRELKPLLVGSTMSYLNSDFKTWSVGDVILRSPDNRSYHVKTENIKSFLIIRYISMKLMLNLFCRCRIFQKFQSFEGGENS